MWCLQAGKLATLLMPSCDTSQSLRAFVLPCRPINTCATTPQPNHISLKQTILYRPLMGSFCFIQSSFVHYRLSALYITPPVALPQQLTGLVQHCIHLEQKISASPPMRGRKDLCTRPPADVRGCSRLAQSNTRLTGFCANVEPAKC